MGIEFRSMDLDELEDILYEVSKGNTENMNTFMGLLLDMYGGINTKDFERLHQFLHQEMDLHSDADLVRMSKEQKLRIINHIHS